MATKRYTFTGVGTWAHLKEPDTYMEIKRWKISVAMDDKEIKRFNDTGSGLKVRETEDGNMVTFRKYADAPEWHDTEKWGEWSAPKVFMNGEEYTGLIGNGSMVSVNVDIYDTKMGNKGHRLNYVTILDLVPYEPGERMDNDEGNSPPKTDTKEESGSDPLPW